MNSMRCSGGLAAALVRLAEALSSARQEEVTAGRRHGGSNVAVGRRDVGSFTHVLGGVYGSFTMFHPCFGWGKGFFIFCCFNLFNIKAWLR